MMRAALMVAAALLLAGCLGEPIPDAAALPEDHDEHPIVLEAFAGMADAELAFGPDPLTIPIGKVVELRVVNEGSAPHTWTVHALDLDTGRLRGGESTTLVFRVDEPGAYEIMCDEPGHYRAGMKATLEATA